MARKSLATELVQRGLLGGKGLIGGMWVPAVSGNSFAVLDPTTGAEVHHVSEMGAEDAGRAVGAASQSFAAWKDKTMQVEMFMRIARAWLGYTV